MASRSDKILLFDILECCERIELYVQDVTRDQLEENYQLQDALIRKLEVIGEAAKGISSEIRDANPVVAWSEMARMRDRMVHQYFRVDLDVVWETAMTDVPHLRRDVQTIYDSLSAGD